MKKYKLKLQKQIIFLKLQSTKYDYFPNNHLTGNLQYTKKITIIFTKCHCKTELGTCTNK